jgi:hypothetical protein
MTEIPLSLKRAGEEVLLALGAPTAEDERLHRELADQLTAEALRDIEQSSHLVCNWSLLG